MKLYSAIYSDFHPLEVFYPQAEKKVVHEPDEMDAPGILILHGGADINAELYKKGRSSRAGGYSYRRDSIEWKLLHAAKERNVLVFGICRGAQMLCAAAGGYLIQDINNHAGPQHAVVTKDDQMFVVNSYHHQMQAPWDIEHEMLAESVPRASVFYDVDEQVKVPNEPEAVYYPGVHGFGVQWHPEWLAADTEANKWLRKTLPRWVK